MPLDVDRRCRNLRNRGPIVPNVRVVFVLLPSRKEGTVREAAAVEACGA
jgi:hypothetical protein